MTFDPVEKPAHYNQHGVEAIQAIEASMSSEEFLGYLKGNAIKYLWRYRYKDNPLQDLDKALWYLKLLRKKFEDSLKEDGRDAKYDAEITGRTSADTTDNWIFQRGTGSHSFHAGTRNTHYAQTEGTQVSPKKWQPNETNFLIGPAHANGSGPLSFSTGNSGTVCTMLGEGDVPRGAGAVQEDVGCGVRCDESAGTVTRQIGMSNRERQASILAEIAEADEAARHVPRHARVGGCETSRKFADIEAHGF